MFEADPEHVGRHLQLAYDTDNKPQKEHKMVLRSSISDPRHHSIFSRFFIKQFYPSFELIGQYVRSQ